MLNCFLLVLTVGLQDSENLVTSGNLDLRDTVRVSEEDTDLRGGKTLSSVLDDLLNNGIGGELEPRRSVSRVRESRSAHSLSFAVHSSHF